MFEELIKKYVSNPDKPVPFLGLITMLSIFIIFKIPRVQKWLKEQADFIVHSLINLDDTIMKTIKFFIKELGLMVALVGSVIISVSILFKTQIQSAITTWGATKNFLLALGVINETSNIVLSPSAIIGNIFLPGNLFITLKIILDFLLSGDWKQLYNLKWQLVLYNIIYVIMAFKLYDYIKDKKDEEDLKQSNLANKEAIEQMQEQLKKDK